VRRVLRALLPVALALVIAGTAFAATRSRAGDGALSVPASVGAPLVRAPGTDAPVPAVDAGVAVDALAHAPSGRSGIPAVDATIDATLRFDPAVIAALGAVSWDGTVDCTAARARPLDAAAMAAAFAATRPPLHSAFAPAQADAAGRHDQYALVFGRGRRGGAAATARAWRIDVAGNRITGASTYCGFADVLFEPPLTQVERYLLLPPVADLPPPVALHANPPATGRAALDAIVAEALAGNAGALTRRLRASDVACSAGEAPPFAAPPCDGGRAEGELVSSVAVAECGHVRLADLDAARGELASLLEGPAFALHAIAALPAGYAAAGDMLVLLSRETRRYNWASLGLVVDGDAITGLLQSCGDGRPEWLYPPTVLVGPFADASSGYGPTWSGIPVVDRAIVAISNSDRARLLESFDPVLIGCVAEAIGVGSPPLCLDDEAPGTLVPVIPVTGCEGGYLREAEFGALADTLARMAPRLYAVTAPPRGFAEFWRLADYTLLIFDAEAAAPSAAYPTIAISGSGIAGFSSGCGASLTSNLLRPSSTPEFVLPPPS